MGHFQLLHSRKATCADQNFLDSAFGTSANPGGPRQAQEIVIPRLFSDGQEENSTHARGHHNTKIDLIENDRKASSLEPMRKQCTTYFRPWGSKEVEKK